RSNGRFGVLPAQRLRSCVHVRSRGQTRRSLIPLCAICPDISRLPARTSDHNGRCLPVGPSLLPPELAAASGTSARLDDSSLRLERPELEFERRSILLRRISIPDRKTETARAAGAPLDDHPVSGFENWTRARIPVRCAGWRAGLQRSRSTLV